MLTKKEFNSIDALKAYVGEPAITAAPIRVDQATIDTFAEITRDRQWIHVDTERAASESPFGTTIAHGLLTLSLITAWYNQIFEFPGRKISLNYGFDKVRFISPVPSGSALIGSFQLARVDELREDEVRCMWQVTVHADGTERPVMVAEWLMQMRY
ncbi:MaoC family dehydratase [Paraburkholderia sp. J12]|uniref:MaoC family dehydratase n=1 Tax=Paraburkholderia sp. J12 TaxID=2805432 RepID=UPI002ABE37BE|nr:MaoC family dehydratase [Paraburkholderia sp. J12]